jgi:GDPmannose 4,6-dehydratase
VKALITGVGGQDGYYLKQLLLSKGYEVVGIDREQDISDPEIRYFVADHKPDEVYNLAAVVGDNWEVNANGAAYVMSGAWKAGARFFQASTCQMLAADTAYAKQKHLAHRLVKSYRADGSYAVGGILFNHESPRRPAGFVTQKVARGVADIVKGRAKTLVLGDLDACRDWGHASDHVRAMWLTLQQDTPDDYQIGTGEMRSVRELCDVAFNHVGLNYRDWVTTSPVFYRPDEPHKLRADPSKLMALGWKPEVSFDALVKEMVDAALER